MEVKQYQPGQVQRARTDGRAMLTANATPESFGMGNARTMGAVANAMGDVTNAAMRIQSRHEMEAARAEATKAFSESQDALLQKWGEISQLQGKEAANVYKDFNQFMEDHARATEENLDSQFKKDFFRANFEHEKRQYQKQAMSFQLQKTKEFEDASRDSVSMMELKKAVQFRNDPATIAESEGIIAANTAKKFHGMGEDVIQAETMKSTNMLHRSIVEADSETDPNKALAYMKANKDKFDPLYFDDASKKLEKAGRMKTAEDTAKLIADLPLSAQMKQLSTIQDPETRAQATKMARQLYSEKKAFQELQEKQVLETEADKVRQDPANYKLNFKNLSIEQQDYLYNLRHRLVQDEADRKSAKGQKSDPETYFKLREIAASGNDKALKAETLKSFADGNLSYEDMHKFADSATNPEKFQSVHTASSFVTNFVKEAKLDVNEGAFFSEMFERELNNYPEQERKKTETMNKVKDSLLMNMSVKGQWLNDPYWKVKFKNKEAIEPADKPKEVPDAAQWGEKKVEGKNLRGWTFTNADGATLFYSATDKGIYRMDKPKPQGDNFGRVVSK